MSSKPREVILFMSVTKNNNNDNKNKTADCDFVLGMPEDTNMNDTKRFSSRRNHFLPSADAATSPTAAICAHGGGLARPLYSLRTSPDPIHAELSHTANSMINIKVQTHCVYLGEGSEAFGAS